MLFSTLNSTRNSRKPFSSRFWG